MVKNRAGNVLMNEQRVLRKLTEYFKEFMNEENKRKDFASGINTD